MKTFEKLRPEAGLRVLVTAGAAGIGEAMARAFADVEAHVHVCDIDGSAVQRLTSSVKGITGTVADASVAADVETVFEDVNQRMGGLDLLINNAGIAGPTGPVEDIDVDRWERTVAVNLNSQFYFLRRAVPLLKKSEQRPSIIAMSSVAGRLGYAFRTPYSATKWAIVGMMKSLAIELGPQNIRINAILPGVVEGERMDKVIEARAISTGVSVEAMRDDYLQKISLRRMVAAEDIAALALFLASPAARNLTGQAISVDGNVEYL